MRQAKRLFCVRIYREVAKVVVWRIMRANYRHWPRNEAEWCAVARHFGYLSTTVYHPDGRSRIYFERKRIIVQYYTDRRLFYRDFAHEVTHAILFETAPPNHLLFWPVDADDAHYTAQLVEEWVDADLAKPTMPELPNST
jgi:hypothetical protein